MIVIIIIITVIINSFCTAAMSYLNCPGISL